MKKLTGRERILLLLANGGKTRLGVEEALGLSQVYTSRVITKLRREKLLYVCGWVRSDDVYAPVYATGNKEDAPRPKAMTSKEKWHLYMKRLKEKGELEYRAFTARRNVRDQLVRRKKRGLPPVPPDPMLAWIPRRDLREAA